MNPNLAQALAWLGIPDEETAVSFFRYLNFAGYLDDALMDKAGLYLHTEKAFVGFDTHAAENIATQVKEACRNIADPTLFLNTFLTDFAATDIVDLIVFLQQTAFDRNFAQERNLLTAQAWMAEETNRHQFMALQRRIGLVEEQPPLQSHYHAVGIMGASYHRVRSRISYFKAFADLGFDAVFAVTGQRDLSKGLDGEANIQNIATQLAIELHYVHENGQEVSKQINETQMVKFQIESLCPEHAGKIGIIDSSAGEWHWRADTTQSAKDFAWTLLQGIQQSVTRPTDHMYRILLVVEQPYANRMTKQVQRALDEVAQAHNAATQDSICFLVEASGKGIPYEEALSETEKTRYVTQSNSDFAAWIAECYKDARVLMVQSGYTTAANLRHPNSLMYSSREKYFLARTPQVMPVKAPEILSPPHDPLSSIASRRNPCYGFAVVAYLEQNWPDVNAALMQVRNDIIGIVDPERTPANCPRRLPEVIKTKSLHASFYGSAPYIRQSEYADFFQSKETGLDNGAVLRSLEDKLMRYLLEQEPQLIPVGLEFKAEDGTILARYRLGTNNNDARPLASLKQVLDEGRAGSAAVWDPNPLRDTTVAIVLCVVAVKDDASKLAQIKAVLTTANAAIQQLGSRYIERCSIIKAYDKRTLTRGKHVQIFSEVEKNKPMVTSVAECK